MATTTHSARRRQCTLHGDGNALSHSTTMEFLCSEEPLQADFAYNCFTGSIREEWASMKLASMMLEANQFSGAVPPELGKLINLETLVLSSNQLTGNLPLTLLDYNI
ncbi:hypothetical protein PHAVU_008G077750 [Phaseolus vulgaris]|uniref:probable LRR receptor-like serine/threonine-protein kinase RFK1 isoform X4 n=1 Tax=Phaseolus vulgaris TaxID=3885 RepID=UPI0035C9A107